MKSTFSIHNIFGDHMVLQRRKPVRVAGTASGAPVDVATAIP